MRGKLGQNSLNGMGKEGYLGVELDKRGKGAPYSSQPKFGWRAPPSSLSPPLSIPFALKAFWMDGELRIASKGQGTINSPNPTVNPIQFSFISIFQFKLKIF